MDSKEPEIKKPEEINDAPLPEDELKKVAGGKPDLYLQIDGIKGESTDSEHKD
jgi:hypothetical protein